MKKRYRVKLRQVAENTFTVRANSPEEAAELAKDGIDNDEFGTEPFRDTSIEVASVREVGAKQ